jgi:hypothetical protein
MSSSEKEKQSSTQIDDDEPDDWYGFSSIHAEEGS